MEVRIHTYGKFWPFQVITNTNQSEKFYNFVLNGHLDVQNSW